MKKVLITGSEGLIGNRIRRELLLNNFDIIGIDLKPSTLGEKGLQGDILDAPFIEKLAQGCEGIIHLAAVSRVVDGQKNPDLCKRVNVTGTNNIVAIAQKSPKNPWVIYASSREVYGEVNTFPVTEDTPLKPVNVYGHSKAAAEDILQKHMASGGQGAIVRFSNVYGDVEYDHRDRVVPAFAYAAAMGGQLSVEGKGNSFDFAHLDDTIRGLLGMVKKLDNSKKSLPPIHFVTGRETTLIELAELAVVHGNSRATIADAPPRDYDVSRFYGSYNRAKTLLDWQPRVALEQGIKRLINDFLAFEEKRRGR